MVLFLAASVFISVDFWVSTFTFCLEEFVATFSKLLLLILGVVGISG